MPAESTVRVKGYRDLQRAFSQADKKIRTEFRGRLREAAEPVRSSAETRAKSEIRNITNEWSAMRVGITTRAVYVAPRQRGVYRRGDQALRRPNLAGLLMDRAMQPALDANAPLVEKQVDNLLGEMERDWGVVANRKLVVEIVGDASKLSKGFKQASNDASKFNKTIGVSLSSLLKIGGAVGGITLLTKSVRAGITEFTEQQKVAAQTAAAIKSTGGAANVSAKQIDTLALSLSNLSGIDDELIKSGENVLLSFKTIRNAAGAGNDIFNRATKAAVDFASRTGKDVPDAARLLGKALADPASKLSALARAGVVFTKEQLKTVAAVQKTQGVLAAQKIVLKELADRFGGAAKAAGGTLPGKLNILRERFKDIAAELVGAFAPALTKSADSLIKFLSDSKNQARIQKDVAATTKAAAAATTTFLKVLEGVKAVLGRIVDAVGGLEKAVKLLVAAMVASKVVSFAGALTGVSTEALAATGRVSALRLALLKLGAIGAVTVAIEILINKDDISKQLNEVTDKLPGPKGPTVDLSKLDLKGLQNLRKQFASLGGGDSDKAIAQIDRLIKKILDLNQAASGGLSAAGRNEGKRATRPAGGGFADEILGPITRASELAQAAIAKAKKAVAKQAANAKQAAAAAKKASEDQRKAFDALIDAIGLRVDKAATTKGFADDLKRNTELQTAIKKQIAVEGKTTELARQLFEAQQARDAILKQQAAASKTAAQKTRSGGGAASQASQFRGLGLTGAGDQVTPTIDNLKKQLSSLTKRFADDPKVKGQLARIGDVLSGAFGKATEQTRQKIKEMFDAIRGEFSKQAKGPLTKTTALNANKILGGLGLDSGTSKKLKARLSGFNSAGIGLAPAAAGSAQAFGVNLAPETHVTVKIDGKDVEPVITKRQQTRKRRNPSQKRGHSVS